MRKKILLDGPQVVNDKRGWYAVIDAEYNCTVWHPKDSPDVPDDISQVSCFCSDLGECIDYLVEEGWLDVKWSAENLPDVLDFPVPV